MESTDILQTAKALAALILRAAVEERLKAQEMFEHIALDWRSWTNSMLKSGGTWPLLSAFQQELLSSTIGTWDEEVIDRWLWRDNCLGSLLWSIQVKEKLSPFGDYRTKWSELMHLLRVTPQEAKPKSREDYVIRSKKSENSYCGVAIMMELRARGEDVGDYQPPADRLLEAQQWGYIQSGRTDVFRESSKIAASLDVPTLHQRLKATVEQWEALAWVISDTGAEDPLRDMDT